MMCVDLVDFNEFWASLWHCICGSKGFKVAPEKLQNEIAAAFFESNLHKFVLKHENPISCFFTSWRSSCIQFLLLGILFDDRICEPVEKK